MRPAVDQTIEVLRVLNEAEPRKIQAASIEKKASILARWLLVASFIALAVLILFVLSYSLRPVSDWARLFVASLGILSTGSALLALICPVGASVILLFRWKTLSFEGLCNDMRHELAIAGQLTGFDTLVLKEAKFWLERRVARISARTALFFGEKTAALGLLALSYSFVDKFGGFSWIATTLSAGVSWDNFGNAILLGAGAFLLGISIGSIFLAQVAARYRFQIELIELADS